MSDRKGLVTIFGNPLTLTGTPVDKGSQAPDAILLDGELNAKSISDFAGKVLIIATIPSLDTPVCDAEARRFNVEAAKLSGEIQVLAISMDLPFAQKRWCAAAGIDQVLTLSDHRDAAFGTNWGVLIKELRLLARAVFVVGRDGTVAHAQIVPEVTNEPDYDAALAVAKNLL